MNVTCSKPEDTCMQPHACWRPVALTWYMHVVCMFYVTCMLLERFVTCMQHAGDVGCIFVLHAYTPENKHVGYMLATCIPHAHYMHPASTLTCRLHAAYMQLTCTLHATRMHTTCRLHASRMHTTCINNR